MVFRRVLRASMALPVPASFLQGAGSEALCAVLAVALVCLVHRIRLQQFKVQFRRRIYERLDERTRIPRDLHDAFFQGVEGLLLRFNTGTALLKPNEPTRAIFEEALKLSDRVMLEGRELMLDLRDGLGDEDAQ